jgi:hypothetical protein
LQTGLGDPWRAGARAVRSICEDDATVSILADATEKEPGQDPPWKLADKAHREDVDAIYIRPWRFPRRMVLGKAYPRIRPARS